MKLLTVKMLADGMLPLLAGPVLILTDLFGNPAANRKAQHCAPRLSVSLQMTDASL